MQGRFGRLEHRTMSTISSHSRSPLAGSRRFVREFLIRPKLVGAIAPSSRGLARRMVEGLEIHKANAVVEFGPGTGAFTAEILGSLAPGATFFAIERSPSMASDFRRRFPSVTLFEDSAEHVAAFCERLGVTPGNVDCIVSGLPFASFPEDLQRRILGEVVRVLRPGGRFVTFTYHVSQLIPSGPRFRRILREYFPTVTRSRAVWLNIPPAFVYRCRTAER
jgi:phosphatidylethanolamine/phosphatidyl-N-methylethanolamine N-methyltransferase